MALKMQEIRAMADDILREEIEARRARMFHARFEAKSERHENSMAVKDSRREIAQMLTVLSERKLTAQKSATTETK